MAIEAKTPNRQGGKSTAAAPSRANGSEGTVIAVLAATAAPAFSDACRWIWARMSRGLISDDDLAAKLARLRSRIMEADNAVNHSR